MTDYIAIPADFRTRHQTSSYGQPDKTSAYNPFPQNAAAPQVTRISYGSTAGPVANRSSWNPNPNASLRPPSQMYGPRPMLPPQHNAAPSIRSPPPPTPGRDVSGDHLSPPSLPWTQSPKYDSRFQNPRSPTPGANGRSPTYLEQLTQEPSWIPVFETGMEEPDRSQGLNDNSTQSSSENASHGSPEMEQFTVSNDGADQGGEEEYMENVQEESMHDTPILDEIVPGGHPPWDNPNELVYTPPATEKKSRGFPFVGGFKFMSKLRKKPRGSPLEPQHPPSPTLHPKQAIEIPRSTPSPNLLAAASSTPHRKPALTPLQPTPVLAQPSTSQPVKKHPAATWYSSREERGPPFPVPEARIELPRSDEPRDSITDTSGSSKSSHFAPLGAQPDIIGTLPNPHETQLLTTNPNAFMEAVHVTPQAAPDYDRMSSDSVLSSYRGDSFLTHVYYLGQFLKDLFHLPFIGKPKTVEYNPGASWRAKNSKTPKSWYKPQGEAKLDLLAAPNLSRPPHRSKSTRPSRPRKHHHRHHHHHHHHHHDRGRATSHTRPRDFHPFSPSSSMDAATAIRPAQGTLRSATSGGVLPTSPGASSHGHGNQSIAYSYYYGSQPMYVYPAQIPAPSRGREESRSPKAGLQPTVPIYMMALPPGVKPPFHGGQHHSRNPHRHHHRHSSSSTSSPPRLSLG